MPTGIMSFRSHDDYENESIRLLKSDTKACLSGKLNVNNNNKKQVCQEN